MNMSNATNRILAVLDAGGQAIPPGCGIKSWTVLSAAGDLVGYAREATVRQLIDGGLVAWQYGNMAPVTAIDGSEDVCELGDGTPETASRIAAGLVVGTRYIYVGQSV